MTAYALLLRQYTDEFQSAAWEIGYSNPSKLNAVESEYERKVNRIKERLHKNYGMDQNTFLALKEQAMTM